jgi:DNA polymerase-3 subunit epsilon
MYFCEWMHYVIVDIETTGGGPTTSKITEIALIKHDGSKVIDEYCTLLDPEMSIPGFIVRLTGINDDMVTGKPKFFEIAKKIIEFTEGCVFVAHNVGFDYRIIRQEFKHLGYDYRRHHLCTVRASRSILPNHSSYGLGKLSKELGIEIIGRHRAGGDAQATAILFELLMNTDSSKLQSFIQEEVNPKMLHPNLSLETLDELPERTGVYIFYNETNQIIYIGKSKSIKTRVEQHLRNNHSRKGINLTKEIARIEWILTGSELIALIRESYLVKQHRPIYNQRLKKSRFPFGLFSYQDEAGYLRFTIGRTSGKLANPLHSFSSKQEGLRFLEKYCETYNLCQRLCDMYPGSGACFHHSIEKCHGACIKEETSEQYNIRAEQLLHLMELEADHCYIVDKGRQKGEKSIVYIKNGSFNGFGFAPFHFQGLPSSKWERFIEFHQEDRDVRTILSSYLRKHNSLQLVKIGKG